MIQKRAFETVMGLVLLLVIAACEESAALEPEALAVGKPAYVRVKEYSTLSGEPSIKDSFGGTGYVLKNLNPRGIAAPVAKPTEADATFVFGETVVPIEKKSGPPTLWLVRKAQTEVWLPAHVLTARKTEIDFLKEQDRIPETLSYVYYDDATKTWGAIIGGFGGSFVIDSHGLVLRAYAEGTSPFAIKGNAVIFDESKTRKTWKTPPVFDGEGRAFQLSPTRLYCCVSQGDKPAFECLDLVKLEICR